MSTCKVARLKYFFIGLLIQVLLVVGNHDRLFPTRKRHQEPKDALESEDNVLPCGAYKYVHINESVFIQSPNFNKTRRTENHSCKWRFLFPGCSLALNCPSFRLNDFFCLDYFEIRDSSGKTQRYCGRKGPNLEINTPNKQVEFTYRRNPFFNSVGFQCQVICNEDGSGSGSGGGGVLGGIFGVNGVGIGPLGVGSSSNIIPAHPAPPSNCSCGEGANGVKIINGEMTAIGEFPWMAALVRAGNLVPFCGASLINSRYVMTAAHCVNGRTPESLQIVLNEFKLDVGTGHPTPPIPRNIEAIIPHRSYTTRLDNDIAVIKLRDAVDLTGDVVPVCLPADPDEDYLKKTATVTGWGTTSEGGFLSRFLLKADVDVISNDQCSLIFPLVVTSRMLCAYRNSTDACQGDSGGPLMHAYNFKTFKSTENEEELTANEEESIVNVTDITVTRIAKYTQIGIVSWGQGCARPNKPGVYTRITEFVPWLRATTQDGSFCVE